jgi:hypothetical protein
VIKRAIALYITMNALTDSAPEFVDYSFTAIRPQTTWPDQPADETEARPELAGASLHHFGGFMRTSWRVHDWMWGRIDGSQGVVDLLLTPEQIDRLTYQGDAARVSALAERLVSVAIPAVGDTDSYATSRLLALYTFKNWSREPQVKDGPQSATALERSSGEQARLVEAWRAALVPNYTAALTAAAARTSLDGLRQIRADVRRRFRFAILSDELEDLVQACRDDGGPVTSEEGALPDVSELRADPDDALRRLTPERLCARPSRGELAQDGENAAANVFYALGWHLEGNAARGLAKVTSAAGAFEHALRLSRHYVGRFRP